MSDGSLGSDQGYKVGSRVFQEDRNRVNKAFDQP